MYLIIYCPTMKVPIFELHYLKKSDILSSNTSEMKYMVIFALCYSPYVMRDGIRTDISDVIHFV